MAVYYLLVYCLSYLGLFATSFYVLSLISFYKQKRNFKLGNVKTVSIIIPAYNEEKSIARTINSALELDYPKDLMEIIIIDDGSKDDTYRIAKTFVSLNHPVVKVLTKKNGGKGSALNYGIANCKSEIVLTMDADTFAKPDSLKEMIKLFHDDYVMAVTPSMGIHNPKTIWQRVQQIEYYLGVFLRQSFASVNAMHITPGAFSAYRRKFFVDYGGYDEHNLVEDLEIALRIQSHNYSIENSAKSVVYTISPKTFKQLMVQRRRWYVGLVQNLWNYRRLFGFKNGPLGVMVLPVAVIGVILSVSLTVYSIFKTLIQVREDLFSLSGINFKFIDLFEINSYTLSTFFYRLFSEPIFLIGFVFIILVILSLFFSKMHMKFKESLKLNFVLFLIFYSILSAFWWIVSLVYILFSKKVVWRKE